MLRDTIGAKRVATLEKAILQRGTVITRQDDVPNNPGRDFVARLFNKRKNTSEANDVVNDDCDGGVRDTMECVPRKRTKMTVAQAVVDNSKMISINKKTGSITMSILHAIGGVVRSDAIHFGQMKPIRTAVGENQFYLKSAKRCPGHMTVESVKQVLHGNSDSFVILDPRNKTGRMRNVLDEYGLEVDYLVAKEDMINVMEIAFDIVENVMGEKGSRIEGGNGQNICHEQAPGWNTYDESSNENIRKVMKQIKKVTSLRTRYYAMLS